MGPRGSCCFSDDERSGAGAFRLVPDKLPAERGIEKLVPCCAADADETYDEADQGKRKQPDPMSRPVQPCGGGDLIQRREVSEGGKCSQGKHRDPATDLNSCIKKNN